MLTDHQKYLEDVRQAAALPLPFEKLCGSSILISGAAGMIASCLIDVLMEKNRASGLNCRIYAMGRNEERARARFGKYFGDPEFRFVKADVNGPLPDFTEEIGFVFHAASNTHPVAYATDPIGTIATNIIGTKRLLDFAASHGAERFVFASSNEIYGENRGDTELFDESYCGYIDCNTLRAGYPEGKRCGEALCQAYIRQKGLPAVIARFTRSYGPSMKPDDTKAISQFLKKGIRGEDIVLKSAGTQYYSYTYVTDAVSGLLYVLLLGESGAAYNIADERSDITLRDLAALIAEHAGSQVVFELPDEVESAGFSRATKARLDGAKLQALGWRARYGIREGIPRTMEILRDLMGRGEDRLLTHF